MESPWSRAADRDPAFLTQDKFGTRGKAALLEDFTVSHRDLWIR